MCFIYSNIVEGELYIATYFCSCYLHRVTDVIIYKLLHFQINSYYPSVPSDLLITLMTSVLCLNSVTFDRLCYYPDALNFEIA